MGGIKRITKDFKKIKGLASQDGAKQQAAAIAAAAETQAAAIRAEGERQAAAAKEAAATQSKALQDQQVASNMALQQSINQNVLAQQLRGEMPAPEREPEVDLSSAVTAEAADPRRRYQSARTGSAGVGIQIA